MRHIHASSNPLYKQVQRLMRGARLRDDTALLGIAHSDDAHLVVLEGLHLCEEWLRHRGQPQLAIIDPDKLKPSSQLFSLMAHIERERQISMDARLLAKLSSIGADQGVLFLAQHRAGTLPSRIQQSALWLDAIQDPGNVGTLLRTAAAAGIRSAFLSDTCAQAWSPRVLRAGQGAHFAMHIYERVDLHRLVACATIPLCVTSVSADARSLFDCALPRECIWIFGSEGRGVDDKLCRLAHYQLTIPQDPAVESLNVAAAAAICLFEQRRQWR